MGLLVPEPEALLVAYLAVRHPELRRVSTDTAISLQTELPVLAVEQVPGGGIDGVTLTAVVDIHAFAGARDDARDLAVAAWNDLHLLNRHRLAPIDAVVCTNAPHFVDYGDSRISRFLATYEVAARLTNERKTP